MLDWWWRLIRFGFRLLYNEMAFTYDLVSTIVSLGAWRCWQRASLSHLPAPDAGPVLELAHGTGKLQIDLKQAGYTTIGLDVSRAMGRIAGRKITRSGWHATLVRAQAQALPFADGVFASVVSTFPTDFILQPQTLNEANRVLRSGGRFVIVPNAVLTGGGFLSRMLEWLYRITGQRGGESIHNSLWGLFAQHGFGLEFVEMDCPRSRVLVLVARKLPSHELLPPQSESV